MGSNFESRLAQTDEASRRRHGVYYTPPEVAAAMVRAVDHSLRSEFGLGSGLADESLPGSILDPACGDGVFLEAALRQIYRNICEVGGKSAWPTLVRERILPRLHGCELFAEAVAEARWRLLSVLSETGVADVDPSQLQIRVGDALAEETWHRDERFSAIIGNPPYLAATVQRGDWLKSLMTGGGQPGRNYYAVDGQPLGEKKLWLHDDYVQFFRLAQWHLDRSGFGVLGFLTNHGYLDNPTFRGMRWELLRGFDQIQIVDLHGNVKKREKSAAALDDENVFAIEQGVAIGLFSKFGEGETLASVHRGDLWGSRTAKLAWLSEQPIAELARHKIQVSPPHYFFLARDEARASEYERGLPILELFDKFASAVVTARDKIVIDHDRDELLARIGEFRDDQLSDDVLRRRYFASSRGRKYPPGDTRSWKLAAARAALRADTDWQSRPMRCLYRPFDYRWIYWTPEMIDWPRGEIMRSLASGDTIGLIVRRQMPAGQECNYFGVTNAITLDGVLRSDNRGNESILPLAISDQSNLRAELLGIHRKRWKRDVIDTRTWAALIYALFHATDYRERYADQLRIEFPRLFWPSQWSLAEKLIACGERLFHLHLPNDDPASDGDGAVVVDRGYPKYRDGQILVGKNRRIAEASPLLWKYRFGVHQVLEKWLKDRRGYELSAAEVATYRRIIAATKATIETRQQIDAAIAQSGGWAAAMVDRDGRPLD
ncbi:type ISP restriction/modification enzyme [Blastopirellula retiformator]|uniref:type ISP restriction/modification enzyme n=1 Tax=Blastopirellula retiformator TaxID=2527970 RepID=UPI0016447E9E|nr:type ISP restriction/modification enzyme [Blastopirellula retiformator]